MQALRVFLFSALLLSLGGCGINTIPSLDEQVKSQWAEVQSQYQRRMDLIPNLVATVQGYAKQEKEVLTAVTRARSSVGGMQMSAEMLNNPEALKNFEQAQARLGGALQRLMVVAERYPDLKSNQNFLQLQSQLEGTENRIAVARKDFIESVRLYNTELRTFPGRIWHTVMYSDLPIRETYTATTENAEQAPNVQF